MPKNISRELRKYLYSIAIAAVPVAVYFGWIEVEASVLILPLLVAVLNLTPKEGKEIDEGYVIVEGSGEEPVDTYGLNLDGNPAIEATDDGATHAEGDAEPIHDPQAHV